MIKPKLTVIMAEYNTPTSNLELAIKSILNQSLVNFELIIVDDNSLNNISNIANKISDHRIKVIKNNTNMGVAYSRDRGIRSAIGDFIVIMDTDDISHPDRLLTLYEYIINNKEYDIVGSLAMEFTGDKEIGVIGWAGENTKSGLVKGRMPIHASTIINKKAYLATRYKFHYRRAEDYVLFCEMAIAGSRMHTINKVLYFYRVDPKDYKKRKLKMRKYEIKARIELYPKLGAKPFEYIYVIKSILAGIVPARFAAYYRSKLSIRKNIEACL